MYQITIKIPKQYYNEEAEYDVKDIINDALAIVPRLGDIAVSNDSYEVVGYNSVHNDLSAFVDLQEKYEHIAILLTEITNDFE